MRTWRLRRSPTQSPSSPQPAHECVADVGMNVTTSPNIVSIPHNNALLRPLISSGDLPLVLCLSHPWGDGWLLRSA